MRDEGRYSAQLLFAAVVYGASMIMASYLLGRFQFGFGVRLGLALLPAAGFLYMVSAWVSLYRKSDELVQKVLLESLVSALVACILGAMGLYYFQKAGFFPPSEYPHLDYFGDILSPSFLAGLVFGWWRASRRYL